MKARDLVRLFVSIGVTVGLSAFLLSRVEIGEVPRLVRNADPGLLGLFVLLSSVGLVLRTERYHLLLEGRVGRMPLLLVTAVRNFLADLVPARAGSLSYVVLLRTRLGVPMEPIVGSFVLSFLYDLVAMAVLLTIALVLEFGTFEGVQILSVLVAILGAGSVTAVFLLEPILRIGARFLPSAGRLGDARAFVGRLADGLAATAGAGRRFLLVGLSVAIRLLKFGAYWALLLAVLHDRGFTTETLPFWRVFLGIAGAELSATLPIHGIAGFGTYEAAWAFGFSSLGFDEETAILSGFATHLLSQIHDYALGLVALAVLLGSRRWGRGFQAEPMRVDREPITVVSGLPRSGTSMMMQMLEAAGLEILTDGRRTADVDNPKGYYELETVKRLEQDASWVPRARGKVVKVVSPLLDRLPEGETYRIVFIDRALPEVLASQREMLRRRGEPIPTEGEDAAMAKAFERHLTTIRSRLASRAEVSVLEVRHREVVESPRAVAVRVATFLGGNLDVERMARAVDRSLHRQRA